MGGNGRGGHGGEVNGREGHGGGLKWIVQFRRPGIRQIVKKFRGKENLTRRISLMRMNNDQMGIDGTLEGRTLIRHW